MVEVHTGSRPGRPALLLSISAVILFGTLGLAWNQAHGKRALTDPRPVRNTPLVVRLPANWVESEEDPGVFVLHDASRRGELAGLTERQVHIRYNRLEMFVPPRYLLKDPRIASPQSPMGAARPAKIGRIPGIEFRQRRALKLDAHVILKETITRVACTPRGDLIIVEYWPLESATPAEEELLDSICASIDFSQSGGRVSDIEAARAMGVVLPDLKNCTVFGPDLPQVAELQFLGTEEDWPGWTLGLRRTWLASNRTPAALLMDYLTIVLEYPPDRVEVLEWGRPDGIEVAQATVPIAYAEYMRAPAAFVIKQSANDVLLLTVEAMPLDYPSAAGAARKLAERVAFRQPAQPIDVDQAESAGRALAAFLTQKSASEKTTVHAWRGRLSSQIFYKGLLAGPKGSPIEAARVVEHAPNSDSAAPTGYRGRTRTLFDMNDQYHGETWTMDAQGVNYTLELKRRAGSIFSQQPSIAVVERREAGGEIQRHVDDGRGRPRELSFPAPPNYISPPLETLAANQVAREKGEPRLISISSRWGSGASTQLLRRLELGEADQPRVLVLDDYWPAGTILTFDDEGEVVRELQPALRYERVAREEARGPLFRQLRTQ